MALIQYGLGVTQISGRVGGQIYSHNRGGPYVRNGTIPTDPESQAQSDQRGRLGSLSTIWVNTLTQTQRDGWDVYANAVPWINRLGASTRLTGLQMFQRTNTLILQAGKTRIDDAPTLLITGGPVICTYGATEGPDDIVVGSAGDPFEANTDDDLLIFFQGTPRTLATNYMGGPYLFLGTIEGDSVTPPSFPVSLGSVFNMGANQRHFVRCRHVTPDGRVSASTQGFANT
jgi:hypothetical protein